MPKISKPVLYGGLLALGAAAYIMTAPEPVPAGKARSSRRPASSRSVEVYTQEDLKAKFERVNVSARNAFKPLIVRKTTGAAGVDPNAGGIPALLTDGDPNWVYTGSAVVNGSPQALLENKSTGEGVFLTEGQQWKRATVLDISAEALVFQGPSGDTQTIMLQTTEPVDFAPASVGSPLSGPIGGFSVQPDGSASTETRERRGRRNRNGGNNATD